MRLRGALTVSVFLLSVLMTEAALAAVYVFTDASGVTHFTNVPSDPRYAGMTRASYRISAYSPGKTSSGYLAASNRYAPLVQKVAREHSLDRALLQAMIAVESGYDPLAVSPKGAVGLMQLMPETARRYGVRDLYDPAQNIQGGAKYLRDLMRKFNNDLSLTLAAYNAGEDAIVQYGNRIPPYRETLQYVPRVLSLYRQYQRKIR
jgi:soluble lytic murein transglycosylase-like protein